MPPSSPIPSRVAYVVKVYPRFSETFIVNEILAHEAAGLHVEIVALRPTTDTHFQDILSRVRAPVTWLKSDGLRAGELWSELRQTGPGVAAVWPRLLTGDPGEREIYQALLLARLARDRGISHLHAHFATSACTVARLASLIAGIPYTFTAHAKDIFHEDVRDDDIRLKLQDAAAAITVSDYNVRYMRDRFGADPRKLRRIYNGIAIAQFECASPAVRPRTIAAVGRLVEKKGFTHLVDACAILRRQGVEFRCEIFGEGPLRPDLAAQVERLNLGDRVTLAGPRPQRDIMAAVQSAAAFAAPCVEGADGNRDGLPTVLLEAMALGTPCVSTDVTGIPEAVRHRETGLIVPQGNSQQLAAALHELLDNAALRVTLAGAARELIERDFDSRRNTAVQRNLFTPCPGGAPCA